MQSVLELDARPARESPSSVRVVVPSTSEARWRARSLAVIGVLIVLRLFGAAATSLTDTEGYYASWSSFPSWSYYDHPPMVAWSGWLVRLFSDAPWAMRLPAIASASLTSVLVFELAARLFSPRAAFVAVALHVGLPAFFFTALLLNPESTLAPCWMLALLVLDDLRRGPAVSRIERLRPLLLGALIGLAFLSKYSAILLVPVSLLVLATSRTGRAWLRQPVFYAAGVVALAVVAPVVIWNATRGWPSLSLHLSERVAPVEPAAWWSHVRSIAIAQVLLFHPLALPLLGTAAVLTTWRARSDERYRFLALTSLPVLAFFAFLLARVPDAEPHWTMVGMLPLLVAAGAVLDELLERAPRVSLPALAVWGLSTSVLVAATFVHAGTDALERHLPASLYDVHHDGMHETLDWPRVREAIRSEASALGPGAVVAGGHNVLCGHLLYELRDEPRVYCASLRRTALDFVGRREIPAGAPVLFVEASRHSERHEDALPDRTCALARTVDVPRGGQVVASYALWSCPAVLTATRTREEGRP